jgi:alcohol dehydrogenase (cytochrome c)
MNDADWCSCRRPKEASIYEIVQPRRERNIYLASAGSDVYSRRAVVRALDVATGTRRWERYGPPLTNTVGTYSGLLATGGGLVFGASAGHVFALDSTTRQELWRVSLGGETVAAPITFTVDGHQVIAMAVGRAMFMFEL